MSGIAEEHDLIVVPALDRRPIADVGPDDPLCRRGGNDRGDRFVPRAESCQQFPPDVAIDTTRRRIRDREPINLTEADADDAEAFAAAPASLIRSGGGMDPDRVTPRQLV
jgi:hypothetical protein